MSTLSFSLSFFSRKKKNPSSVSSVTRASTAAEESERGQGKKDGGFPLGGGASPQWGDLSLAEGREGACDGDRVDLPLVRGVFPSRAPCPTKGRFPVSAEHLALPLRLPPHRPHPPPPLSAPALASSFASHSLRPSFAAVVLCVCLTCHGQTPRAFPRRRGPSRAVRPLAPRPARRPGAKSPPSPQGGQRGNPPLRRRRTPRSRLPPLPRRSEGERERARRREQGWASG